MVEDAVQEQIADLIAEYEDGLITNQERYEQQQYTELSEVASLPVTHALKFGLAYLTIGDCERGREWLGEIAPKFLDRFERTANDRLQRDDQISKPFWNRVRKAVYCALVSDKQPTVTEILTRAHTAVAEVPSEALRDGQYEECFTLVAVAAGAADADHRVSELRAVRDRSDGTRMRVLEAQVDVFAGIRKNDPEVVVRGVKTFLDYHREVRLDQHDSYDHPWTDSIVEEAVCLDGCAFVALARRAGLSIWVSDPLIPDCLAD